MRTFNNYFNGLMKYLPNEEQLQLQLAIGATESHIQRLLDFFPKCPESLTDLLRMLMERIINHGEEMISVLSLGSDIEEYPYYEEEFED